MASQITSVSIVCSPFCSRADQRKHQSSASLDFVRGIHRWPVDPSHKGPVTRKMFPCDDVVMMRCRVISSNGIDCWGEKNVVFQEEHFKLLMASHRWKTLEKYIFTFHNGWVYQCVYLVNDKVHYAWIISIRLTFGVYKPRALIGFAIRYISLLKSLFDIDNFMTLDIINHIQPIILGQIH